MALRVLAKPDCIIALSDIERDLAYGLMAIGVREIKAENVTDVYGRLQFLDRICAVNFCASLTPAVVISAIGFKINGGDETTQKWRNRMAKSVGSELAWKAIAEINEERRKQAIDRVFAETMAKTEQEAREAGLFPSVPAADTPA